MLHNIDTSHNELLLMHMNFDLIYERYNDRKLCEYVQTYSESSFASTHLIK